jgi:hypothetical protein
VTAKANDKVDDYKVVSAMDRKVRAGVKAYHQGDFEAAAMFMRSSLKESKHPNRSRKLQSNLCAIYAAMGHVDRAYDACAVSLSLSPSYAAARINQTRLKSEYADMRGTKPAARTGEAMSVTRHLPFGVAVSE